MKSQKVAINTDLAIGIDSQVTRHVVAMEELAYFYKILEMQYFSSYKWFTEQ